MKKNLLKIIKLNYKDKYNGFKKKSDSFGKYKPSVIEIHYSTKLTFTFGNQVYNHAQGLYLSYMVYQMKRSQSLIFTAQE